jgi:hypothetical protein
MGIGKILGIIITVIFAVIMSILVIGASVINLFDRERKEDYERQVQQTDKKSDKQ